MLPVQATLLRANRIFRSRDSGSPCSRTGAQTAIRSTVKNSESDGELGIGEFMYNLVQPALTHIMIFVTLMTMIMIMIMIISYLRALPILQNDSINHVDISSTTPRTKANGHPLS